MTKAAFFADLDKVRVNSGVLTLIIPQAVRAVMEARMTVDEPKKYKFVFDIVKKKKPRSTGPKGPDGKGSQQYHLHGHLSQIADYTGYYMSEIKEAMKEDISDWPRKQLMGRTVYMSEADADTVLESKAIEWCHVKSAELGIILIEEEGQG